MHIFFQTDNYGTSSGDDEERMEMLISVNMVGRAEFMCWNY